MTENVDPHEVLKGLDFEIDLKSPTDHINEYAGEFVKRCKQAFGEDVKLGQVVIVAEVWRETLDDKPFTEIATICSDPRDYLQVAILEEAITRVEQADDEDDEDEDSDED